MDIVEFIKSMPQHRTVMRQSFYNDYNTYVCMSIEVPDDADIEEYEDLATNIIRSLSSNDSANHKLYS